MQSVTVVTVSTIIMSQLSVFPWIATFTIFTTRPTIVLKQSAKRGWNIASRTTSSSWSRSSSVPFLHSDRFYFVSRTSLNSRRHHSTNDYSKKTTYSNNSENPFVVLGVSIHSDWETVQRAFVQLALKHHPDTSPHHGNGEGTTDEFLRIRAALEHIRDIKFDTSNNKTNPIDNNDGAYDWRQAPEDWSDLEYEEWLRFVNDPAREREYLSFDMSESTRHEVIDAYKTMRQHGNAVGHDRGGYWEMARQIVEREERRQALRGGAEPTKQLHAGEAHEEDKDVRGLRRQRKR